MPNNETEIISSNNTEDIVILWSERDPLGNTVVLREDTVNYHILDTLHHSQGDVDFRRTILPHAPGVIKNPLLIVEDNNYNENKRICYVDELEVDGRAGSTCVTVSVDTDREPYEVVTIVPRRDMKGLKGGIIYDANDDRQEQREV